MNRLHVRSVDKPGDTINRQPGARQHRTGRSRRLRNKQLNLTNGIEHRRPPTGGQDIRNPVDLEKNIQSLAQIARFIERTMKRDRHPVSSIDNA